MLPLVLGRFPAERGVMPPLPPVFRAGPSLTLSETLLVAGRKSLGRPVCTTPGEFAPNQPPAATAPPPAPASARTRLLNLVLDPLCSAPIPPCVAGRFGANGMLAPGVERRAECGTAPLGVLGVLPRTNMLTKVVGSAQNRAFPERTFANNVLGAP